VKGSLLTFGVLLGCLFCATQGRAQVPIDIFIGTVPPPPFSDGTHQSSATYIAATSVNPAPFNAACGTDAFSNCSAAWTFSYTVPSGDNVTSAILSLGIFDNDSAAMGSQVASFTLNGTTVLTSLLDASSEAANSANSFYNVLTITVPGSDITALDGGTATFALSLQGPGLGALTTSTFNGAGLVYSELDMEASGSSMLPTPEASTWVLFLAGMSCFGLKLLLRRTA
jgi:hypothetical protein